VTRTTLIELDGLQGIEIAELREELPEGTVTISPRSAPSRAEHGDFGATAIVVLSAAAIHGLSVWLAKRRVETKTLMEGSVETTPEGAKRVTVRLETAKSVSEPPPPETVAAFESQLSTLMEAATGGSPA
jgi:hypothetical protein